MPRAAFSLQLGLLTCMHLPTVVCSVSFYAPEGYIDSGDYPPLPQHSYLECTYNVTVYTGYGVELQVRVSAGRGVQQSHADGSRGGPIASDSGGLGPIGDGGFGPCGETTGGRND